MDQRDLRHLTTQLGGLLATGALRTLQTSRGFSCGSKATQDVLVI